MNQIEVVVDTSGNTSIEAVGFNGPDCEQATQFLEEALGTVKQRRHKPEYMARRTVVQRQRVKR